MIHHVCPCPASFGNQVAKRGMLGLMGPESQHLGPRKPSSETHLLQTWAARNPSTQEALGRHISWFLVRRASHNTSHNTSIRRVSARLAMSPESDPPHPSHSRSPPGSRARQAASYSKLCQSRVCEASNVSKYDGRPRTLRLRLGLGSQSRTAQRIRA